MTIINVNVGTLNFIGGNFKGTHSPCQSEHEPEETIWKSKGFVDRSLGVRKMWTLILPEMASH